MVKIAALYMIGYLTERDPLAMEVGRQGWQNPHPKNQIKLFYKK